MARSCSRSRDPPSSGRRPASSVPHVRTHVCIPTLFTASGDAYDSDMPANLSLLTSRKAVEEAIAECDELTRDAFLKKYRYKRSRLYPLEHNGKVYDSKAIAGVAFGKQHGTPLKSSEFSGGLATVVPLLRNLQFLIRDTAHPARVLRIGKIYYRKDLLRVYGGQLQRGIWTPKEFPVVFLFSGDSGELYGYQDGWDAEKTLFKYTGEGQKGEMTFSPGNKAIRDHRENDKDLLLFADLGKGKGVRYEGLFECIDCDFKDGLDKERNPRKIIVFDLVPVNSGALSERVEEIAQPRVSTSKTTSLEELRKAAYIAAEGKRERTKTGVTQRMWFERSHAVRAFVLARANGICEACDQPAPFQREIDGTPYLETHHTTRMADEGLDHPQTVGAICPTCHRRIHSGVDGIAWNKQLKQRLLKKTAET